MPWSQDNTRADADDAVDRTCSGRCGEGPEITVLCPTGTDPFLWCDPSGRRPPKLICATRGEVPPIIDGNDNDEE
jgi:hypothetical protein